MSAAVQASALTPISCWNGLRSRSLRPLFAPLIFSWLPLLNLDGGLGPAAMRFFAIKAGSEATAGGRRLYF